MATIDQFRQKFPKARGLSDNQIIARLSEKTGLPYEDIAARFGFTEDSSSGFLGGTNDLGIELANSAAGLVGAGAEFVSPGNRFSRGIQENFIKPGEDAQTVATALQKRKLQRGLETSEVGPQVGAALEYAADNPLLVAAQALGGFGVVGKGLSTARAGAGALGLGTKGTTRVMLGTGGTIGAAGAGGDAAGTAYDLVMNTPREVLLNHPQALALVESGVTDEAQIYEELATRAARKASIVPAIIGFGAGATGLERVLASGTRGARDIAVKTGTEFATEFGEEGATAYSGRKAAQTYDETIDPMQGVIGQGTLGGIMGAGITLPTAIVTNRRAPEDSIDLTQDEIELQRVGREAQELPGLQGGAFTSLDQQRDIMQGMESINDQAPFSSLEEQQRSEAITDAGQQFQTMMRERTAPAQEAGAQWRAIQAQRNQPLPEEAVDAGQQWQELRVAQLRQQMDQEDAIAQAGAEWQALQQNIPQPTSAPLTRGQRAALRGPAGGRLRTTSEPLPPAVPREGVPSTSLLPQQEAPATSLLPISSPIGGAPVDTAPVDTPTPSPAVVSEVPGTDVPGVSPAAAPAVAGLSDEAPAITITGEEYVNNPDLRETATTVIFDVEDYLKISRRPRMELTSNFDRTISPSGQLIYTRKASAPVTQQGTQRGTTTAQAQQTETQGSQQSTAVDTDGVTAEQEAEIQSTIDELGLRPLTGGAKENLDASVQGGNIKVGGTVSLPARTIAATANNFLTGRKGTGASGKLAAAMKKFSDAYRAYLDAAGNMVPSERKDKEGNVTPLKPKRGSKVRGTEAVAAERAQASVDKVRTLWKAAQSALGELGVAADNNAKNVEAMVKVVKGRIAAEKARLQGELDTMVDQDTDIDDGVQDADGATSAADAVKAQIRELERLDIGLSRGWAAAKRGNLRNDTDMLDVRGGETRTSTEEQKKGATQPLVAAATEGARVSKRAPLQTGFQGVLNYIRSNGSPFERMIAKGISEVFKNTKNPPKVVFAEGTPQYDPRTNTITMSPTASTEVALHEGLHAALQWFVHTNPKSPYVVQLLRAVDKVVKFDTKQLSPKAAAVQKVLADLVKGKRELDAVLELVSYGNTLVEFRKALEAMPTDAAPSSFVQAASDVWNMILATVRRMLGVPQSVASDVIMDSFKLLSEASGAEYTKTRKGGKLDADIRSDQPGRKPIVRSVYRVDGGAKPQEQAPKAAKPAAAAPTVPATRPDGTANVSAMPLQQAAQNPSLAPMSKMDFTRMSKTIIPQWVSSKVLFDTLGWNKITALTDDKLVTPLSEFIQKNSPGMTKAISWVNSHYALPAATKDRLVAALTQAKDLRRGGSGIYEDLANYFATLPPAKNKQVLQYMDAKLQSLRTKSKAPVFPTKDDKLKLLADATIDGWWTMAKAEPDPKLREAMAGVKNADGTWTGGTRFSRGLVFPSSVKQLASSSFGARNIGQLVVSRTKNEVNDEAIRFSVDENNDPVLTSDFIGLYKVTPVLQSRLNKGERLADIQPDEFISAERFAAEGANGFMADTDFVWTLKGGSAAKGYKFSGRLDPISAKDTQDGARLGHALQNTMTIMANSYSANTLANSLFDLGRANKTTSPDAVAFDNLEELNRTLNGTFDADGNFVPQGDETKWDVRVGPKEIVDIAAGESKSETVKGLYRHRDKWVRLPAGPTYGKLGGKIVNGAVWSAIEDMSDRRPLVNSAVYNGAMRWFKKAKTIYNPATWGTNVASNITMAMMDDIPMATLAHASRLYALYHVAPQKLSKDELELMVKIKATNALLGDFSSNEVKQSIYDSMKSTIDGAEKGVPERVMQFFNFEKSRTEKIKELAGKGRDARDKFDKLAVDWYSAQDNVFRVASMLNQLGQAQAAGSKMDNETFRLAGDHSRFAFLDYDIDSKAVRIMRQTAFPFISWPYAAAKLVGNIAVHRPWKLVNLYAGYWMIEAVMQAMTGDDDEEDAAKRKVGPEWARERLLMGYGPHASIRVPFLGDDENPVFYGLGKYMVPSSFGDRIPNGFMGISGWPSFLNPGGPFVTAAVVGIGGVDPFNGEPLAPPTATSWEAAKERLKFMQSMFVPNLPRVNLRETDKYTDAISGRTDKTDNHAALYFARLAGLRLNDYNVNEAAATQSRAAKAIMRDYKIEISKLRRAELRRENPDWDAFNKRQDELYERMQKEIDKAYGEE